MLVNVLAVLAIEQILGLLSLFGLSFDSGGWFLYGLIDVSKLVFDVVKLAEHLYLIFSRSEVENQHGPALLELKKPFSEKGKIFPAVRQTDEFSCLREVHLK